jgi:plasmid stabilization system protein ParE
MKRIRLARAARFDIAKVLRPSDKEFGPEGRARCKALLDRAILDLAEDPSRTGVRVIDAIRPGYRTYHIEWAKARAPKPTVEQPRHLLVFSADDVAGVLIGAVVHEREMLERHLKE